MSTSPDLRRRRAFGWARLGLVFGVIVALNLIGFCCDLASVERGHAPTPSLSLP